MSPHDQSPVGRTPTSDGVRAAMARIQGAAVRTPLIENDVLNEITGARVLLKAETFQHLGSFKFRGAYNLLSTLPTADRARGVVAWSSGNHAQGVALAARRLGLAARIVMPHDAPAIKTDMVRALGAEIIGYDRYSEDREAIAYGIAEETGAAIVPSYDHPLIIEGQGTSALEAVEDAERLGVRFDAYMVCCGGGGLAAGSAFALAATSPETDVYIVEPEGYDDARASLEAGKVIPADVSRRTICDAIATPSLGALTFPVLQQFVSAGLVVADDEAAAAVRFGFERLKIVLEPGGAVALASLLFNKISTKGKVICATLSGGNVDASLYAKILTSAPRIAP